MPLSIKNDEVERLVEEVASLAGETKTEAVRVALIERRQRLAKHRGDKRTRVVALLEKVIWPKIPPSVLGQSITKEEEEEALGYGPDGI